MTWRLYFRFLVFVEDVSVITLDGRGMEAKVAAESDKVDDVQQFLYHVTCLYLEHSVSEQNLIFLLIV